MAKLKWKATEYECDPRFVIWARECGGWILWDSQGKCKTFATKAAAQAEAERRSKPKKGAKHGTK